MRLHTKVGVLQHPHPFGAGPGAEKAWLRHSPLRADRKCAGVPHADDGLPRKAKAGWTVMSGAVLSSTASSQRDPGRDPAGNLLAVFNLVNQLQNEKC